MYKLLFLRNFIVTHIIIVTDVFNVLSNMIHFVLFFNVLATNVTFQATVRRLVSANPITCHLMSANSSSNAATLSSPSKDRTLYVAIYTSPQPILTR